MFRPGTVCAQAPARWTAAVVLATALGACSEDGRSEPLDQNGTSFTSAGEPLVDRGLVWADGGAVHLGDGSTIQTQLTAIDGYAVGGVGVYAVAEGDDRLVEAAPDGVRDTGASADPATLRVSSDGRYLAFIDRATGAEDGFGTPQAQAVVVDLVSGEEVARTAEGMGDPDDPDADLLALYEDSTPGVFGILDGAAYVDGADGDLAVDLQSGAVSPIADDVVTTDAPWYRSLAHADALTSPDGSWTIRSQLGESTRLDPTRGGEGVPVSYRGGDDVLVNSWVDDRTAAGVTGAAGAVTLVTCPVSTGRCEPVAGTERGVSLPADRLGVDRSVVRRPAE